ncbi:MAG: HAMP domain-containing histidine kinase [Deltaproteobacteria bacterium]|nr:HAMP domain-containing histidine kinase [Deltaproteobacteria bacterium]
MARPPRSTSTPIILASVAVPLAIAILVGWILLIALNIELSQHVAGRTWLLVTGVVSLVFIMVVLVLFSVFLVREIMEVRRQNSFIDSVTHELKSPLASLKLCAETLARDELSIAQREELRQMMLGDVERLSVFIDDVLEASRIAHGLAGAGQTADEVDVGELVSRCAASVAKRHNVDPASVVVDVAAPVRLVTDVLSLEIVFKNLLDNAVKYSGDVVRVVAKVDRDTDGRGIVTVRDEGIGIARRHLRRVFERFYRVQNEPVRARHGSGLGLFVVASLVEHLGGKIVAQSDGEGFGTMMRVTLPRSETR